MCFHYAAWGRVNSRELGDLQNSVQYLQVVFYLQMCLTNYKLASFYQLKPIFCK